MVLRKLVVGMLSLGLLVPAYIGYRHLVETPAIETDTLGPGDVLSLSDANAGTGGQFGQISDIDVQDPRYIHRDENGRVDREMGFKSLFQEGRDVWLVSQPFMNLYPSNRQLTCSITADEGAFQVENSRNPYASDVTFKGNVRVHLIPEPNSTWEEIEIFLDDIVFLNDKTQFSSEGAIHVKSPRVDLLGEGMQFVYDPIQEYIQYFHLFELKQLRVKAPRHLFSRSHDGQRPLSNFAQAPAGPGDSSSASPAEVTAPYECVLHKNVLIQTPQQQVLSYDRIALTDLLWRGPPEDPSAAEKAQSAREGGPSHQVHPAPDEPYVDIKITCDNGLLMAPHDANWVELEVRARETPSSLVTPVMAWQAGQALFEAREINYNVLSGDAVAEGPLELTFFAPEPNESSPTSGIVPIKVSAQKRGVFLSQANSFLFEDHCECRLLREEPNAIEEYELDAPKLRVELVEGRGGETVASTVDLKRLEASGGNVHLGIYSRTTTAVRPPAFGNADIERLLAGIELQCQHIEVDPNGGNEIFIATGPGTIRLNNAKSQGFGQQTDSERRYYAMMEGFDKLWFYLAENRIVADGNDNTIVFDYFPIVEEGETYQEIRAQANHIEIQLVETAPGQRDMDNLVAEGNVYFQSSEPNRQLQASGLSYDHQKKALVMWSDLQTPCLVDGFPVPGIQMDTKTGEIRTEFIGPVEFSLY